MRKSKLFLTGALLVAAVVGVAATKGMKSPRAFYYYQKGTVCQLVSEPILCQPGGSTCKYDDNGTLLQIFASRTSPETCTVPLRNE